MASNSPAVTLNAAKHSLMNLWQKKALFRAGTSRTLLVLVDHKTITIYLIGGKDSDGNKASY
jgi:hypothetical protein